RQEFKPFDRLMLMLSFLGNGYLYVALLLGVMILDPVNAGTVLLAGILIGILSAQLGLIIVF
ncbi:MAG: hypothetical protein JXB23_04165, partial [Candidatus Aminicenantes bacterium]|nr:hypothetical protein [Candidatus Aminicenantes bacterium]